MTERENLYKQQLLQNTALTTVNDLGVLPVPVAQEETVLELYNPYLF